MFIVLQFKGSVMFPQLIRACNQKTLVATRIFKI